MLQSPVPSKRAMPVSGCRAQDEHPKKKKLCTHQKHVARSGAAIAEAERKTFCVPAGFWSVR